MKRKILTYIFLLLFLRTEILQTFLRTKHFQHQESFIFLYGWKVIKSRKWSFVIAIIMRDVLFCPKFLSWVELIPWLCGQTDNIIIFRPFRKIVRCLEISLKYKQKHYILIWDYFWAQGSVKDRGFSEDNVP